MIRDTGRAAERLRAFLPESVRVTRGWPKDFARLPCVAVSEISNRHLEYRDDDPYLDEVELDARVFATRAEEIDELSILVEQVMESIGYRRILSHDDDSADTRMLVLRYRQIFNNNKKETKKYAC